MKPYGLTNQPPQMGLERSDRQSLYVKHHAPHVGLIIRSLEWSLESKNSIFRHFDIHHDGRF